MRASHEGLLPELLRTKEFGDFSRGWTADEELAWLDPRRLARVDAWLAAYRSLWSSKLDSLKRSVERAPREGRPAGGTRRRATAPTRRAMRGARAVS